MTSKVVIRTGVIPQGGTIELDGQDISMHIGALSVDMKPGNVNQVAIMLMPECDLEFDAEVTVVQAGMTVEALNNVDVARLHATARSMVWASTEELVANVLTVLKEGMNSGNQPEVG